MLSMKSIHPVDPMLPILINEATETPELKKENIRPCIATTKLRQYVDGAEVSVRLFTTGAPGIVILDDVVNQVECRHLINLAKENLVKALVTDLSNGGEVEDIYRIAENYYYTTGTDAIADRVEQRIMKLTNWSLGKTDATAIIRYRKDGLYAPHYDYFPTNQPGSNAIIGTSGNRVATMVVYLSNVEEGGGTSFPETGVTVCPKLGGGVFFEYPTPDHTSLSLHGGDTVKTGEKWILVKWFRG